MLDDFLAVFGIINSRILLISVLLFFIGYALAPTAYYKKYKWLLAYPFFIIHLMEKHFKRDWPAPLIFLVILTLNSLSLYFNLLSGWIVFLPYFVIIYLGLNVGVIIYHTLEGKFFYLSLFNPVALIELPAAWISITMAIQFSLGRYIDTLPIISFMQYTVYFLQTIIPILVLAGIIETALIVYSRRYEKED